MAEVEFTLPTYRYVLKVDGKVVFHGFTTSLEQRLRQHKRRWPRAEIEQIGEATTHRQAYEWAKAHLTGTDPRN